MDGRCETCRWWVMWSNAAWSPPEHRKDWRVCELMSPAGYSEEPKYPQSKAFVDDDHAGVYTAPDFGCVQWEAKEEAT